MRVCVCALCLCRNMNPYVATSFSNWAVPHRLPIQCAPCATDLSGTSSFGMSGVNAHAVVRAAPSPDGPLSPWSTPVAPPWRRGMRCFVEVLVPLHPLLGAAARATQQLAFSVPLGRPPLAFLWDHRVNGAAIMPGAGYLELAAAAASTLTRLDGAAVAVVGAAITAPLVLPAAADAAAVVVAAEVGLVTGELAISSCAARSAALPHLRGALVHVGAGAAAAAIPAPPAAPPTPPSLEVARAACTEPRDAAAVYADMRGAGLQYGPAFRYGPLRAAVREPECALPEP